MTANIITRNPAQEISSEEAKDMRELVQILKGLPRREREKFLYMAQGAALVEDKKDTA